MFRRRQTIRYLIRAPICIALLVIGVLAYLGKFNSSKIFDVARKAISDIQNIRTYNIEIKRSNDKGNNTSRLEYYGDEKLEKYILFKDGSDYTEVIYDYDRGKMYVRVDTLVGEGLTIEGIDNLGRKWNGEQWIKTKNYLVLNVRQIVKGAIDNGELDNIRDWIDSTPKIKGLVYGLSKPAYKIKESRGDELPYLYSDFIIYLLENAVETKYITRSGILESIWSIDTKNKDETEQFISSTLKNINSGSSTELSTIIKLLSEATGEEQSKQTLIDKVQETTGVKAEDLIRIITDNKEDVSMKFNISFEDNVGKANLTVEQKYRNEEGRRKTQKYEVNYLSRGDTSIQLRVPNIDDCIECNSIEEFEQVNKFIKVDNIIKVLLMNNESEVN